MTPLGDSDWNESTGIREERQPKGGIVRTEGKLLHLRMKRMTAKEETAFSFPRHVAFRKKPSDPQSPNVAQGIDSILELAVQKPTQRVQRLAILVGKIWALGQFVIEPS